MISKLSKLDRMIYDRKMSICVRCKDGDTCGQDLFGIKPEIIHNKMSNTYTIGGSHCKKMRGTIISYVNIKTYTNLITNKNRERILAHLRKGMGGFIYGEPGNGKSYVLGAVANEINKSGKNVYVDLANNIAQKVFNFETRQKTLDTIIAAEYVFIDDFGGEKFMTINGFDTVFDCWTPIIKTRIDNGRPTYFSSNYSLKELAAKIAAATDAMTAKVLLDRVSTLGVFEFKDKDYRRD